MYGTREAAQNWEYEYVEFTLSIGFLAGKVSPCVFYNKERNVRVVVTGVYPTQSGAAGSAGFGHIGQ